MLRRAAKYSLGEGTAVRRYSYSRLRRRSQSYSHLNPNRSYYLCDPVCAAPAGPLGLSQWRCTHWYGLGYSLVRLGVLTGTAWRTHWYGLGYSYARKVDGRDLDAVDVPEAVVGVHDDRPAQHIRKNKHVYLSSTQAWYPGMVPTVHCSWM